VRASPEELKLLTQAGRDPKLVSFFEKAYTEATEQLVAAEDARFQLIQGKARTLHTILKLLKGDTTHPSAHPGKRSP